MPVVGILTTLHVQFDLFPKTFEDFRKKTASGGTVSIVAISFLALIFFSEFIGYLHHDVEKSFVVDSKSQHEKLKINFDIVFHKVPCSCTYSYCLRHDRYLA